jgi:hypothetical protein
MAKPVAKMAAPGAIAGSPFPAAPGGPSIRGYLVIAATRREEGRNDFLAKFGLAKLIKENTPVLAAVASCFVLLDDFKRRYSIGVLRFTVLSPFILAPEQCESVALSWCAFVKSVLKVCNDFHTRGDLSNKFVTIETVFTPRPKKVWSGEVVVSHCELTGGDN